MRQRDQEKSELTSALECSVRELHELRTQFARVSASTALALLILLFLSCLHLWFSLQVLNETMAEPFCAKSVQIVASKNAV